MLLAVLELIPLWRIKSPMCNSRGKKYGRAIYTSPMPTKRVTDRLVTPVNLSLDSGPALPSAWPQSQGPLRGPPDYYISLFDVPTFSASLRICGAQSKAKCGVLFTSKFK